MKVKGTMPPRVRGVPVDRVVKARHCFPASRVAYLVLDLRQK